jgi:hypothetical protein
MPSSISAGPAGTMFEEGRLRALSRGVKRALGGYPHHSTRLRRPFLPLRLTWRERAAPLRTRRLIVFERVDEGNPAAPNATDGPATALGHARARAMPQTAKRAANLRISA